MNQRSVVKIADTRLLMNQTETWHVMRANSGFAQVTHVATAYTLYIVPQSDGKLACYEDLSKAAKAYAPTHTQAVDWCKEYISEKVT